MDNNNNSNASAASGNRGTKRRRRAAPPGQQPATKKQRPTRQNRKRAAKRGRAASTRGGADVAAFGGATNFFAPVSQGTVMKKIQPYYALHTANEMRVLHREKITKLTTPGTGVFTVLQAVLLNPGLAASFPWLSNESAGYESYRFHRVRFVWVPTSSTASDGNIIMAPEYDASDPAPAGETAISSYTDCEEANVWVPFCCDLESDLLNGETRRKFIRYGALGANQDIKLYDSGALYVASTDDTAVKVGKLWVEYDVSLFNPQVPPGGFQATGSLQSGGGGITNLIPFGAVPVSSGSLVLSAGTAGSQNVVTVGNIQVGQEIAVFASGSGTVITAALLNNLVGLTLKNALFNGFPAAATSYQASATYIVTAQNPTFTLSLTATTITGTACIVSVLAPIQPLL
jgi:hypothetical protein